MRKHQCDHCNARLPRKRIRLWRNVPLEDTSINVQTCLDEWACLRRRAKARLDTLRMTADYRYLKRCDRDLARILRGALRSRTMTLRWSELEAIVRWDPVMEYRFEEMSRGQV